jgi:GMP synthase (glutamine-hydrolysing)
VSGEPPILLAIQHVPWEAPHRILDSCADLKLSRVAPLAGDPLPPHGDLAGVVSMGGPMSVDDVERHPALAVERAWLAEAARMGIPVLAVCLGAQLLARGLGASVAPGGSPEIGFAPVEIDDPADPVLGALAPRTTVLHWHRDVFDLPSEARSLARSERTPHQAFRFKNAWGVLFHAEADASLVERWLAVPEMVAEARDALGSDGVANLPEVARAVEVDLIERSTPGFRAFGRLVAAAG